MMEIRLDEGFQFGLGAFETIAIEGGKPIFVRRHLNRLQKAADFLGFSSLKDRGVTEEAVYQYLTEENVTEGALKIMLSGENCIMTKRGNPYTEKAYQKGFVADISKVRRNETSPLVYHKTMNYGDCILEKRAAAKAGMNERIFLNTEGQICEGTVSNIFFVQNGHMFTPALSCGLLPGIMREYLLEHYNIEETEICPEQLEDYEECFVTNSLMGIMPVKQLGTAIFSLRDTADRLRNDYLKNEVHK